MAGQTASQGSLGGGQQTPDDSNSEVSVIMFIAQQLIARLETMIPVQVTAVHAGSGNPPAAPTVDVQILVSQLDGSGNQVKPGKIFGLPVFRLQGGPWAVICDPVAKDFGFIISASRDISAVTKTPGVQPPASYRKYSYSDSIYVGGAFNQAPTGYLWLKSDGTINLTTKDGVVIQSDGSGNLAINPKSGGKVTMSGNLAVTGNITATGNVTAGQGGGDQVGLQTHVHAGVQTGGGSTAAPTAGT